MKKVLFAAIFLFTLSAIKAQKIFSPDEVKSPEGFENIYKEVIFSDELTSSFIIFIRKEVALHRHEKHSEHVYVIEGTGEMMLGDEHISVTAGDIIVIPKNTAHSLEVTSREPMKIISIQAPLFEGNDRVLIE